MLSRTRGETEGVETRVVAVDADLAVDADVETGDVAVERMCACKDQEPLQCKILSHKANYMDQTCDVF